MNELEPMAGLDDKLRLAASKGLNDKVLELIQSGASFQPDREGRTALHYAASAGYVEVCRSLLKAGCHPSALDNMGYTSLHCAASQGHHQVGALLIEAGCHMDVQDDMHGNSALHEAAWNGYSEMISLLIRYKCNVFVSNKSGFTALHLAAQNGHNQSARILLYGISNPDARNNYGDTPLHTACRYGHAGVTRILISARCRINEQNKNGDTGLHIAAALKRRKIGKLLCEAGIDVNIRNKQNESAADVARRKDHLEIIDIINSQPRNAGRSSSRSTSRGRHSNHSSRDDRSRDDTRSLSLSEHDDSGKKEEKEKKSKFSFFKKKKKDKDKDKDKDKNKENKDAVKKPSKPAPRARRPMGPPASHPSTQAMPAQPFTPTVGLVNQYVPRPGVQYYRDLAGNVKQGPVGYAPVCQCQPSFKRLATSVEQERYRLWEQLDVTREEIQERMHYLDQRQCDSARMVQDRLDLEELACFGRLEDRSRQERMHTRQILQQHEVSVRKDLKDWTRERMQSLERRVTHHDDLDWTDRHRTRQAVETVPVIEGRLFRSRSDETLSVSEYNSKQRVEREMQHLVALRELRDIRSRTKIVPIPGRKQTARDRDRIRAREALSRDHLGSRDQLSASRDSLQSRESRDRPDGIERRRRSPEGVVNRPLSFHEPRPFMPEQYRRSQSEDELSPRKPRDVIGGSNDVIIQNESMSSNPKSVNSSMQSDGRPPPYNQDRRISEPAYAVPYNRSNAGSNPVPYRPDNLGYRPDPTNFRPDSTNYRPDNTNFRSDTTGYRADNNNYRADNMNYRGDGPVRKDGAGYNRTESGSNPDSGYSSRIYHAMAAPRQDASPGLSSGSTGHNISNITTSSGLSRDSHTSQSNPASSPPSRYPPSYPPPPPSYRHRVAQQVEQYYIRHQPAHHGNMPPPSYLGNQPAFHGNQAGHHGYGGKPVRRESERVVATDV